MYFIHLSKLCALVCGNPFLLVTGVTRHIAEMAPGSRDFLEDTYCIVGVNLFAVNFRVNYLYPVAEGFKNSAVDINESVRLHELVYS